MSKESGENGWNCISIYTRKQAIADGVLHDVTEVARRYGFRIPVAITDTIWRQYVEATPEQQEYGQSTEARLGDLLLVLYFRIRTLPRDASESRLSFQVKFLMDAAREVYAEPDLIADTGPGDEGEAVLTVMLPEEE